MARDYAKMFSGRGPGEPPERGGRIVWLVVFVLLLGLSAIWFRFHAPRFLTGESLAERARQNLAGRPAPEPPVHFDFYAALPAAERGALPATPPETAQKAAVDPFPPSRVNSAVPQSPTGYQYVVQLGLFSEHTAASRARLNFLLSGIDSVIVKEKNARGETIFRIQQGPWASEKAARVAEARLRRKGLETLLRKTAEG